MGRDFLNRAVLVAATVLFSIGLTAQSAALFDSEKTSFRRSGWTLSAGLHGFSARPDSTDSFYPIVKSDGSLDTLHWGNWGHEGHRALRLGIGFWQIAKRPVVWDRWSIELHGTRNAAISTFTGLVADADSVLVHNAMVDSGRSNLTTELTFRLYRAFEIIPDFFIEGQLGVGWDREWGAQFSRTGPDSMFIPREQPVLDRIALELGVGAGVRTRSGRYLRILATYDAVQLSPFAEEGDGRVQWYSGQFQPWNLALQWDLLRAKPEVDCAKPPAKDRPAEVLFGSDMEKAEKKRAKDQKKRARKQRKRRRF